MKIFQSTHDFDYPWAEVSIANWRKYSPWNKESQHVIAVDTLSRRIDPDTGILRTERLITCKQAAPGWVKPFLGSADVSYVYELSYVTPGNASSATPREPSVTMVSQNLTWAELLSVHETVTYTPSPADRSSKTRFQQTANITALCGGWQKVRDKVENFTVERFGQNAEKGRIGFEEVLETSRRVFGEEREREKAMNGR